MIVFGTLGESVSSLRDQIAPNQYASLCALQRSHFNALIRLVEGGLEAQDLDSVEDALQAIVYHRGCFVPGTYPADIPLWAAEIVDEPPRPELAISTADDAIPHGLREALLEPVSTLREALSTRLSSGQGIPIVGEPPPGHDAIWGTRNRVPQKLAIPSFARELQQGMVAGREASDILVALLGGASVFVEGFERNPIVAELHARTGTVEVQLPEVLPRVLELARSSARTNIPDIALSLRAQLARDVARFHELLSLLSIDNLIARPAEAEKAARQLENEALRFAASHCDVLVEKRVRGLAQPLFESAVALGALGVSDSPVVGAAALVATLTKIGGAIGKELVDLAAQLPPLQRSLRPSLALGSRRVMAQRTKHRLAQLLSPHLTAPERAALGM